MSKRNESIGTVECPAKGCDAQCDVFRFRERGESPTSVANRRFAGKLYGRCPRHGTFGGSAGDDAMQEYIETNAKKLPAAAAPPTPKAPAPRAAAPAPRAAAPVRHAPAPPARLSPAPPAQPPAKKRSGFGFFEYDEGDDE